MRSTDQELLKWAHGCVSELLGKDSQVVDKYRTAVKAAPAFLQSCGLSQSVAFWSSKVDDREGIGYKCLLEHLSRAPEINKKLIDVCKNDDLTEYVFVTQRCQDSLLFLKRMVDSLLARKES
jgi:CRISPR type III-B/RAMP module-associated protein Cmr5